MLQRHRPADERRAAVHLRHRQRIAIRSPVGVIGQHVAPPLRIFILRGRIGDGLRRHIGNPDAETCRSLRTGGIRSDYRHLVFTRRPHGQVGHRARRGGNASGKGDHTGGRIDGQPGGGVVPQRICQRIAVRIIEGGSRTDDESARAVLRVHLRKGRDNPHRIIDRNDIHHRRSDIRRLTCGIGRLDGNRTNRRIGRFGRSRGRQQGQRAQQRLPVGRGGRRRIPAEDDRQITIHGQRGWRGHGSRDARRRDVREDQGIAGPAADQRHGKRGQIILRVQKKRIRHVHDTHRRTVFRPRGHVVARPHRP